MISIIVSTMNRSDFLGRMLNYYADVNYRHWILIADASNSFHAEKTKEIIRNLEGRLKITYQQYPGLMGIECLKELSTQITTDYAVFSGDDDFFVPSSLEKCINFLENNKEYIGANGDALVFSLGDNEMKGQIKSLGRYMLSGVESDTAAKRLKEYLSNYSVHLFSVQRSSIWKRMFKDTQDISDMPFRGEIFPCCLSVIEGKIKHLDCLYLLRQAHNRRIQLLGCYDWLTSPEWFASYQGFYNRISELLASQDDIGLKEAQLVVKEAFRTYLSGLFQHSCSNSVINKEGLKAILKKTPGFNKILLPVWRKAKLLGSDFSLAELLRPRHRYHKYFMPAYYAITDAN